MPIIAEQHRWKDKDHAPLNGWPDDCTVQWGKLGLVLSNVQGESYSTAFFEAFPRAGGFIRGEGTTIVEAEAEAFDKYIKVSACNHEWLRGKYTDGGATCRHCRGFKTAFRKIVVLGAWREPLSAISLDLAAEGVLRPCPEDPRHERFTRKTWLKARRMGIDLPDFDTAPPETINFGEDGYARESRLAVLKFFEDNPGYSSSNKNSGLHGPFEELSAHSVKNMIKECSEAAEDELIP